MGTRSEIWITDGKVTVELYKHWDGYPEYMVPLFRKRKEVMSTKCLMTLYEEAVTTHWMCYPEDVSAALIALDAMLMAEREQKYGYVYVRPDIRPRGRISDLIRYIYILRLPQDDSVIYPEEVKWILEVYEVLSLKELDPSKSDSEIKSEFRKHLEKELEEWDDPRMKEYIRKEIEMIEKSVVLRRKDRAFVCVPLERIIL